MAEVTHPPAVSTGPACTPSASPLGAGPIDARPAPITLLMVIDTLREFGAASLELVAWELDVPESTIQPHWELLMALGVITLAGRCPEYGERMYELVV